MITQSELKELIHYNPDTGVFTRISSPRKHNIGIIKTCASSGTGYFLIGLFGKLYYAHRLAWLYVHGVWPKEQIDHINRDKIDNRLVNLREASSAQNRNNIGIRSSNKSGFKGVSYDKRAGAWRALIGIDGKQKHLGYYPAQESASAAYESAAKTIHAEFYYRAA